MAHIEEPSANSFSELEPFAVRERSHQLEGGLGIRAGAKRQGRSVFAESFAVGVIRVFFLNLRGVQ